MKDIKKQIVIGYAFGDEGKGVTTQYLVKQALNEKRQPIVIRYSGGPQAGHTIFNNGKSHICSSFGAGVLEGVPTYISETAYFDPIAAYIEYKDIVSKFNMVPQLIVHPDCRIITPIDVMVGRKNTKVIQDGTCGKGLYQTFKRYSTASFANLPTLAVGVKNTTDLIDKYWDKICNYYEFDNNSFPEYKLLFIEALKKLPVLFTSLDSDAIEDKYDTYIFEGSQGLLLDMDNGFFPNVTPSKVGLNGIPEYYLTEVEVYLVTRTYTTRHGNGYKPKLPLKYDISNKYESNVLNKYQGEFKTGGLEIELLRIANERHCLDNYIYKYNVKYNLVVTHCDLIQHKKSFCRKLAKKIDNLEFENIYYNDSVYSNIKKV